MPTTTPPLWRPSHRVQALDGAAESMSARAGMGRPMQASCCSSCRQQYHLWGRQLFQCGLQNLQNLVFPAVPNVQVARRGLYRANSRRQTYFSVVASIRHAAAHPMQGAESRNQAPAATIEAQSSAQSIGLTSAPVRIGRGHQCLSRLGKWCSVKSLECCPRSSACNTNPLS